MARFHTTARGNIPFTLEEEHQRDIEEAQWTAQQNSPKEKSLEEKYQLLEKRLAVLEKK